MLTSPEFAWAVELLEYWCGEGRELVATADRSPALWPSERGDRLTLNALGRSFTAFRKLGGLPSELSLHALRHCYTTHLLEAGYDPSFVQQQLGHSSASTTSLYTSVSSDFKQRVVQTPRLLGRLIADFVNGDRIHNAHHQRLVLRADVVDRGD